jgi:hypothetical protein
MKPYFLPLLIGAIITLADIVRRSEATRHKHRPLASVSDAGRGESCDEAFC